MFVFRMKLLVVCLLVILPTMDGFIGEFVDYVEDLPFRVMSGACYFNSKRYYRPGQLEIKVFINKPTVDLHVSIGEIYSNVNNKHLEFVLPIYFNMIFYLSLYSIQIVITYCCLTFILIIIRYVLYLFLTSFSDTLTTNNIPFEVMVHVIY